MRVVHTDRLHLYQPSRFNADWGIRLQRLRSGLWLRIALGPILRFWLRIGR